MTEYKGNQWRCFNCKDIIRAHNPEKCGRCGSTGLNLISGTLPVETPSFKGEKLKEYNKHYYHTVLKPKRAK